MIKKYVLFAIFFVAICLFIPVVFAPKDKTLAIINEIAISDKKEQTSEKFNYKEFNNIKLLHVSNGTVETIYLDEYLLGVVAAEMPASYEIEALKAQAIVARTYTIYKIKNEKKHEGADICDDSSCCQAYITKDDRFSKWNEEERESNWAKIEEAVANTKGQIITYNGEPINALFHANSGGETEIASNVWGGIDYPYLQAVATSGEEGYKQYNSSVNMSKDELVEKLKESYPEIIIDFNEQDSINILEYTDSGRVRTIKFGNIQISGVEARKIFGLKSANFSISIGETISFNVIGYGHGVGMSQTGADSMAKEGKTSEEIIHHFYNEVEISTI